jgi:plastocyanin
MSALSRLVGSALIVTTVACGNSEPIDPGGGGGGGGVGGGTCPANTICMTASAFTPNSRTVGANVPVTWTNNSNQGHNVTFIAPAAALAVGNGGSGSFNAPVSSSNQRQFATAGTHSFYCNIHGTPTSGMRGTVVVQ